MNDHAHHAESALAEAMRPGLAADRERMLGAAQVHASLAVVHELREARRPPGTPPVPEPPRSAAVRAHDLLDAARTAWERAPRGPEGDIAYRAAVDEAIGLLGGSPF